MYGVTASNSAAQVSTRFIEGTTSNSFRLALTFSGVVPVRIQLQLSCCMVTFELEWCDEVLECAIWNVDA